MSDFQVAASLDRVARAISARSSDTGAAELSYGLDALAEAIKGLTGELRSPNVSDDNSEPANLVDVINRHARATDALADAITALAEATRANRSPS